MAKCAIDPSPKTSSRRTSRQTSRPVERLASCHLMLIESTRSQMKSDQGQSQSMIRSRLCKSQLQWKSNDLIDRHSMRRNLLPDGRMLPLPLPVASTVFKQLTKWIRMPLILPHVLAAGTATFLDALPSLLEHSTRNPKQFSKENISKP